MKTIHKTIASIATAAFAMIVNTAIGQDVNRTVNLQDDPRFAGNTGGQIGFPDGSSSAALAGQWRYTSVEGRGAARLTSDYHLMLYANGTFRHWKSSYISFTGSLSTTELGTGRWTVNGGSLVFLNAKGELEIMPFQRNGNTIYVPHSRRVWQRAF